MPVSESQLQEQVADYLRLQYPNVLFHSGRSSIIIAESKVEIEYFSPGVLTTYSTDNYCGEKYGTIDTDEIIYDFAVTHGLFLDLKKEVTHLKEQTDYLYDWGARGYCAEFAVGFDEAKKIIDGYLGGK